MNDSHEPKGGSPGSGRRWLLLIHQIPPKPDYLRVKVRRRLHRLGAVLLKDSVYLLPDTEEALEDFEWLAREIRGDGGEAMIGVVEFLAGITDEELDALLGGAEADQGVPPGARVPEQVEPGRTWVTRRGVQVDRIASGWLIRRFIDASSHFKFVPARGYQPRPGELRFDMYDAEYTHTDDHCSFETLVHRFGLADPALAAMGEMVHDIDCKDERYGRPETAGIAALVSGIVAGYEDDVERLRRGAAVFEDLYASLRRRRR